MPPRANSPNSVGGLLDSFSRHDHVEGNTWFAQFVDELNLLTDGDSAGGGMGISRLYFSDGSVAPLVLLLEAVEFTYQQGFYDMTEYFILKFIIQGIRNIRNAPLPGDVRFRNPMNRTTVTDPWIVAMQGCFDFYMERMAEILDRMEEDHAIAEEEDEENNGNGANGAGGRMVW